MRVHIILFLIFSLQQIYIESVLLRDLNCFSVNGKFKARKICRKKIPRTNLECIADYLLLKYSDQLKTRFIWEKNYDRWPPGQFSWSVRRGIEPNEILRSIKITEPEMAEKMGAEEARECFERNGKLLKKSNNEVAFSVWPIFGLYADKVLRLSKKFEQILVDQLICVTNFLTTHYGFEEIERSFLFSGRKMINREDVLYILNGIGDKKKTKEEAVIWANKLESEVEENDESLSPVTLRWKWKNEEEKVEIRAKTYSRGEAEFEELTKCKEILHSHSQARDEEQSETISLDQILNRFHNRDLFVRKIYEEIFEITPEYLSEAKTNDKSCPICLTNYEIGDMAQKVFPCQHIFHHSCLNPWLNEQLKDTCPICRTQVRWKVLGGDNLRF